MPEKMKALYRGGGGFVPGVPARHLTAAEYEALTAEERAALRASGLYEVRTAKELDAGAAEAPAADEKKGTR